MLRGFACFLLLAPLAFAQQEEIPEPPPAETLSSPNLPDPLLPKIQAAIAGVTTHDAVTLSHALHIGEAPDRRSPGPAAETLTPVGDLDGDGTPEMLLKAAIPEVAALPGVTPAPESQPLWALYLLSWNGAHWKASRLLSGGEEFISSPINLGLAAGRGLAIVTLQGNSATPYPVVFELRDHLARLLWDSQSEDSRYQPLLQGRVNFQERKNAPAEMMVSGRADPGLLAVDAHGQRGFTVRVIYHWTGNAFLPALTDFSPCPDYTLYRFLSALHLHNYRAAYALVVPRALMKEKSPGVQAFQKFIQENWPEFLDDAVFAAPELPASAAEEHLFTLTKPGKRYVYHPIFSRDGKFLLTGLTRTHESLPAEQ